MAKKSFEEKLYDNKNMPEIEFLDPKSVARYGGVNMLIAPPLAYDEIMKKIPYGKVITSDLIRSYLAGKHNADFTLSSDCWDFHEYSSKCIGGASLKLRRLPLGELLKKMEN